MYERTQPQPPASWQQGYQIHINAAGSGALDGCIPPLVRDLFAATTLQPSDGVQTLSRQLAPINVTGPDVITGSNRIARTALRSVLLTSLEDVVRFRQRLVRYEPLADARIQAMFDDGSSAVGDVLVAADGLGSSVRAQYLPHARIADTGLVGMAGKLPITDESRSYLPEHFLTRLTGILAPNSLYMIVTQSIYKPDAPRDESDHVIWVLVSCSEAYGNDPRSLFHNGAALQQVALQLLREWHSALRRMVAETDAHLISSTALQAADPIEHWQTTNVTLLEDAIHAMPPLRGLGRSTALRDAALLAHKLAEVDRGEVELLAAIHAYETEMLEYGFEAVRVSMQAAQMVSAGARPRVTTN